MAGRIQLSTGGHPMYESTVGPAFGNDMDWARTNRRVLNGDPDPDQISTSYVERQNLSMRMGMWRFTRLTSGFSKKVENLAHTVSLHFMHYNFASPHSAVKDRYPRTPAIAAG